MHQPSDDKVQLANVKSVLKRLQQQAGSNDASVLHPQSGPLAEPGGASTAAALVSRANPSLHFDRTSKAAVSQPRPITPTVAASNKLASRRLMGQLGVIQLATVAGLAGCVIGGWWLVKPSSEFAGGNAPITPLVELARSSTTTNTRPAIDQAAVASGAALPQTVPAQNLVPAGSATLGSRVIAPRSTRATSSLRRTQLPAVAKRGEPTNWKKKLIASGKTRPATTYATVNLTGKTVRHAAIAPAPAIAPSPALAPAPISTRR